MNIIIHCNFHIRAISKGEKKDTKKEPLEHVKSFLLAFWLTLKLDMDSESWVEISAAVQRMGDISVLDLGRMDSP